jgi:hypothetical protein
MFIIQRSGTHTAPSNEYPLKLRFQSVYANTTCLYTPSNCFLLTKTTRVSSIAFKSVALYLLSSHDLLTKCLKSFLRDGCCHEHMQSNTNN